MMFDHFWYQFDVGPEVWPQNGCCPRVVRDRINSQLGIIYILQNYILVFLAKAMCLLVLASACLPH